MMKHGLRLGLFLSLGLIRVGAVSTFQVSFSNASAVRLDDIFLGGRKAFYRDLRLGFGLHPQRFQLTPADAQRIMNAEREIPYLYERMINLAYIHHAPEFAHLLERNDPPSIADFETRFLSLSRDAAALFVQSLFQEPGRDNPCVEGHPGPRESRLELVLSSLMWPGPEPASQHRDSGLPSQPDLSGFWGLEVIGARSAQAVSRGNGVRVAVLDAESFELSGPWNGPSAVPPLFVRLAAGTQAPWLDAARYSDPSSAAGGLAARLVAAVAPESQTRVLGINGDSDAVYPFWPAYEVSQGIYKAVDGGTDIILVTSVFGSDFRFLKDACAYAYGKNVVVICPNAAGSFAQGDPGKPAHFPAHYNTTVAVAGVVPGVRRKPAPWEKSELSHYTTCAAPTVAGGSQVLGTSSLTAQDNSPAAALVAGTAALICSLLPKTGEELSGQYVQRIYEILCRSCDSSVLGPSSFHPRVGYGLIRADRAVREQVPAYKEKMNQVESRFKKRMEERAAEQQKEKQ